MGVKEINKALGLGEGGIDTFLETLDLGEGSEIQNRLNDIDTRVRDSVDKIDGQIKEYNEHGITSVNIADINSSFSEIKELIDISKNTIKHVYESIVTSELVDSELIQAFSKLMESTHISIAEYISMYKDRMSFYDKVRLETLKHQQKIDLMERKHKLDMEKNQEKTQAINTPNMVQFTQEDIIKMI